MGAAPNYDTDHDVQIRRVFEMAREFDVDIDMHLDSGTSPEQLDSCLVCELTEKYKWGGRVAIGHATKLSTMDVPKQKEWAKRLADAGVAVTVLPATDLFLMGRERDYNVRRGLVDANLFVECGCNCSLSSNNIMNPFTPFGNGSLIRMTNLHANTLQIGQVGADRRMLRDDHDAFGETDEFAGLRHQGRQSGRRDRARGERARARRSRSCANQSPCSSAAGAR